MLTCASYIGQWAGTPGRLVLNSTQTFTAQTEHGASGGSKSTEVFPNWQVGFCVREIFSLCAPVFMPPSWDFLLFCSRQVWAKELPGKKLAVLIINISEQPQSVSVPLSQLGLGNQAQQRNLYTKQVSTISNSVSVQSLAAHDSFFVVLQ